MLPWSPFWCVGGALDIVSVRIRGQKAAKWRYDAGWMVCTGQCWEEKRSFLWTQMPFEEGFPDGWVIKNPSANAGDTGDMGSVPGSRRSPGGVHGNPLQYSCLENSMDRGAWWAAVLGVTKNWTRWATEQAFVPFGEESVCTGWLIGADLTPNRAELTLLENVFPVSLKFWLLTSVAMGPTSFLHSSLQTPSDLSYTDKRTANRPTFFLRAPLLLQRAPWSLGKEILPLSLLPGKMSYLDSLPPKCLWGVDLNMYNIHGQRGQL